MFRCGALKGLVGSGLYTEQVKNELLDLQRQDVDCDPAQAAGRPWLQVYQQEGTKALISPS